jgi:signal transduction histidine kinase
MRTFLKRARGSEARDAARRALADAGVGVVEIDDWDQASAELSRCGAMLVVCDGELRDGAAALRVAHAIAGDGAAGEALPRDSAHALSHDLRTPLSAMSGWVHLMETGSLDEAGLKRAISKLRGNIDDQVRAIERYLGANTREGHG